MTGAPQGGSVLTRARAIGAGRPGLIAVAAFIAGLLLGWWVLGWLVFPVTWTNARTGDLAPDARQAYVQAIADARAADGDVARARASLADIDPATLAADLEQMAATAAGEDARRHAADLAKDLGLPTVRAAPVTTSAAASTPETGLTLGVLLRTVASLVLVAAAAAGLALFWAWWRWRRSGTSAPIPAADAPGTATGPTETVRGRGAPPWHPLRVDLGDTAIARYTADDERYYQTWLVYDERGSLIGGAGLQAHPVGSVNALDLWFFKREDESGEDSNTPIITIVSEAAHGDGVFRARLGDRRAVPAVPGEACVLAAADLALDVRIDSAEPAPGSEQLGLASVTLTLRPRRQTPDGGDEGGPGPLLFHRD
jgi:hypothetical protein